MTFIFYFTFMVKIVNLTVLPLRFTKATHITNFRFHDESDSQDECFQVHNSILCVFFMVVVFHIDNAKGNIQPSSSLSWF